MRYFYFSLFTMSVVWIRGRFELIKKIKTGKDWFDQISQIVDIKRKVDVYRNLNSD